MEFKEFLKKYQSLPVLDSRVFLTGERDTASLRVQLGRWVKAGNIIQLRRGLYVFAAPFQKTPCPQNFIASALKSPSYVSLEKALEYHGLIPEAVFSVTSVTTKRPGSYETALGRFEYQHIQSRLFWGYSAVASGGQTWFLAHPEKALLDFVYLRSVRLTREYLEEWRLQNFEHVNRTRLLEYGRRFEKPGMLRAAQALAEFMKKSRAKEKSL